jgi:hypothetical protein
MRAALLASVVFIGLIALGVRTSSLNRATNRTVIRFGPHGEKVIETKSWTFPVEGRWESNAADAERSALEEARYEVLARLQSEFPPVRYLPTAEFVRDRLVAKKDPESKDFGEGVGTMWRVHLDLQLKPSARAELVRLEREQRAHDRMAWLAKVLGLVVVLLTAFAGYVHLDERTKGYYTNWLRLVVACVVAAVGVGLWWIA